MRDRPLGLAGFDDVYWNDVEEGVRRSFDELYESLGDVRELLSLFELKLETFVEQQREGGTGFRWFLD